MMQRDNTEKDYEGLAPPSLHPGDKKKFRFSDGAQAHGRHWSMPRETGVGPPGSEDWLIRKARQIHEESTNYLSQNVTNQWDTNVLHFRNQHGRNSNYANNKYGRSKLFRPVTRTNIRQQESDLKNSMFDSRNLVLVEPEDDKNDEQIASAELNQNVLQYRLEKRMEWFLTTMGAYQNTKVYGFCVSHQYWQYQVDTEIEPVFDEMGQPVMDNGVPMGREVRIIRSDDLMCDLIPPENFRFDPNSDWRDPVGSSPYIQYIMPVHVVDVLERMQMIDPKTGRTIWRPMPMSEILSTRTDHTDSRTRRAREGLGRSDPADRNVGNEFTLVWAHMNICRVNGEDYVWWTLGTQKLLSHGWERLRDVFPHLRERERPFTMGVSTVEAHRNYPAGDVELGAGLQTEINHVANLRMDNVALGVNKRFFVKRGSNTDLDALVRNTPGGGVMTNDPERDVKVMEVPDVTSSSYEEQDRLSMEYNDLNGGFSQAAAANANSVGGMGKAREGAGTIRGYGMDLFMRTWVNKTLDQMVRLVQLYETDEIILSMAARKSKIQERFGIGQIDDNLLRQSLTVKVDAGMADPQSRIERLSFGISQVLALPGMQERLKTSNVTQEIFNALGYRSADRFFRNEEEQAEFLEQNPQEPPFEVQLKRRELDIREEENRMRDERENRKIDLESTLGAGKEDMSHQRERERRASDMQTKREALAVQAQLKREEMANQRDIKAAEIAGKEREAARKSQETKKE